MTRIQIYDTTLRDGSQAEGISFSLQDKLAITQRLDDLGVDYVEGGYPASNEKDAQYFQRVCELPLKHARVCAFGMTRRKGIEAAADEGLRALLASQAKTITIVGKSSRFQVTEVLRANPEENLAMVRDSVAYLAAAGREVIFDAEHFFDGWKADAGYSLAVLRAAAEAGARMVVLCDTNGGSMPEDIARGRGKSWGRSRYPWASIATTTASWRWPTRWPPSTRGPSRSRVRSTASASAAAMSI